MTADVSTMFALDDTTAVVTGASRGIGALGARVLAAAGARVALCARDTAQLEQVAAELPNDPIVLPTDLADPDGADALVAELQRELGRVDILINNAGSHAGVGAMDIGADEWDRVLQVNLRSAFLLARGCARMMSAERYGKIVNVGSVLGMLSDIDSSAYVTSKAGLLGLTRALATEWGRHGITVNVIAPGWIETDMVQGLRANDAFDRRVRGRTPLGRWGTTNDLAGALLFLSSPASDFVTGQALVVDGGLSARW